jgi:exosortase/archaeosortase family protein
MGLMVLALPALPTAQFVLGFPLRAAAGELATQLLSLAGLAVVREGVALRLGDRLVAIDAPCSGVNMLWTALLVAFVLAGASRCSFARTALLTSAAAALAVAGNAVRAASLFLTESGVLSLPAAWAAGTAHDALHQGLGIVAFALALVPLLWLHRRLSQEVASPCASGSPS